MSFEKPYGLIIYLVSISEKKKKIEEATVEAPVTAPTHTGPECSECSQWSPPPGPLTRPGPIRAQSLGLSANQGPAPPPSPSCNVVITNHLLSVGAVHHGQWHPASAHRVNIQIAKIAVHSETHSGNKNCIREKLSKMTTAGYFAGWPVPGGETPVRLSPGF